MIKSEEKNVLIAQEIPAVPSISINIENEDFWQDGFVSVKYHIVKSTVFTADTKVDYIFYPHLGFEYGEKFQRTLPGNDEFTFTRDHIIGSNVNVFTVGAAFDVTYGDFKKRIVNQKTFSRMNNIVSGVKGQALADPEISIFPNPSGDYIVVAVDKSVTTDSFDYTIFNINGVVVMRNSAGTWNKPINISTLIPGVYYIQISLPNQSVHVTEKIVRL